MGGSQENNPNLHDVLWWRLIPLVSSVAFLAVMWFGSNTYYAGLFGGKEWILAVADKQVPQTDRVLELQSKSALTLLVRGGGDFSSQLTPGEDLVVVVSEGGEVTRHGTSKFSRIDDLLALPPGSAKGFVATDEGVFELTDITVGRERYIRVVGDTRALVDEIAKVSVVEAMLVDLASGDVLQHTWRGLDAAPVEVDVAPEMIKARNVPAEERDWKANVMLADPYLGYFQLGIGRGEESIGTFYAYSSPRVVEGFDPIAVLVLVPDDVMLKYPKRSIAGGIALLSLMVVLVMTMIHRLSKRHINPLADLAQQVERIRDRVVAAPPGADDERVDPRGDAPNHEVASLERVVGGLELEIERSQALERKLRNYQKLEAVGRLAGGIAHDFNNLMNVVSLNVAHLRGAPDVSKETLESLELMSGAINAGAELTKKLMNFGHGGTTVAEEGAIADACSTISNTLGLAQRLIGEDVCLSVDLPERPLLVKMSTTDLQQIILNLTLNARDASGAGGNVGVSLKTLDAGGRVASPDEDALEACIEVVDEGCGMTAEQVDRVFEPFYTTKEEIGGSGFGMSVVFGVVTAAGGTIEIESKPGEGTCIRVRVPLALAEAEADELRGSSRAADELPRHIAGMTCLLVEDDERASSSLRRMFLREGVSALVATDGARALEVLERHRSEIDVVLSDVSMPKVDGVQLAQHVAERYPTIPVILMTGRRIDLAEVKETTASVVDVIEKPIVASELIAAISSVLGRRDRG